MNAINLFVFLVHGLCMHTKTQGWEMAILHPEKPHPEDDNFTTQRIPGL